MGILICLRLDYGQISKKCHLLRRLLTGGICTPHWDLLYSLLKYMKESKQCGYYLKLLPSKCPRNTKMWIQIVENYLKT